MYYNYFVTSVYYICNERFGEYCRRGSGCKKLISPSKRMLLVTSAYQMYRAKRLFEKQGFIVSPYKVVYKAGRNKEITIIDFLQCANYLKNSEARLREIMGRILNTIKV